MEELYQAIIEVIKSIIEIEWADMDYGQNDHPDLNYSLPTPYILIVFPNIQWESLAGRSKAQIGEILVELAITQDIYEESNSIVPDNLFNESMAKLGLYRKIHNKIQGLSGQNFNSLNRIKQYIKPRNDGVKIMVLQYKCLITDIPESDKIPKNLTLNITKDTN